MSIHRAKQAFGFDERSKERYCKAIDQIYSLVNFELSDIAKSRKGIHLGRITTACELLGNPQKQTRTIHVAGTKGKGSTATLIAAILQGCGYKVGLYTSPHFHTLRERIQINFSPIEKNCLTELVGRIFPLVEKKWGTQRELTFFEIMTLFSFVHFASNNVDFQVIETGIGGRLDATNVVNPSLSVITPISIIKPEVPLVVSNQKEKALKVLSDVASMNNVKLINTQSEISIKLITEDIKGQHIEYLMDKNTFSCFLPLVGQHQSENLATAVVSVKALGISPPEGLKRGMELLKLPGRIQLLKTKSCLLLLDVAHNPISMQRLSSTFKSSFHNYCPLIIFGMTTGHDIDSVLKELGKIKPILFPVKHFHPKAVNPEDIVRKAISHGLKVCYNKSRNTTESVLNKILLNTKENEMVLATGSFSVVGEVMAIMGSEEAQENLYEKQLNINRLTERRSVQKNNG
jgi:dihydrofolate synthase/folylpolyglutamate synthase